MRQFLYTVGFLLIIHIPVGICQSPAVDQGDFLSDTSILHCTLVTNLDRVLSARREKGNEFTGNFIIDMPGGAKLNEQILLEVAGNFRLRVLFCSADQTKV